MVSKKNETIISKLRNFEVKPEELRWTCSTDIFNFKTTAELEPLENIIGQPRAIEAIRLGSELESKGYNIFVSGLSGTGRLTTVKKILESLNKEVHQIYDYCYVNNFSDPDVPRLIKLPKGKGKLFANTINDTITFLKRRIPKMFEDEEFQNQRKKIIEEFQKKERDILHEFDERIKPFGFVRGQIENDQGVMQPEVFPLINDKPISIDNIEEYVANGTITREKADELISLFHKFHQEIFDLAKVGIKLMQEFRTNIAENDKASASMIVSTVFDDILKTFPYEKVDIYINELKQFTLDNLNIFVPGINPLQPINETDEEKMRDFFNLYAVNVILDNSGTDKIPIITETTPTYNNLFGTIERTFDSRGFWRTDFRKIKAGSLLKADNGFLIVNALDIFDEPGVWQTLKRVLLYNKLEIRPYDAVIQLSQIHLKPEPIEVNVKVVIIGGLSLYRLLYHYEKGFKKIFKVNAQFDYETEKTEEMMINYARFISKICNEENIPHCTPDGVAAIIEWAVEHSGSKDKITLKFSDVADIIRESAFYDRGSKRKYINREDVQKAIEFRRFRNNMMDEKLRNLILKGTMLIDTEGRRVGQINGLTIIDDGILSFGKPTRITTDISAGTTGIINIEREVEMSGSIHSKGVMILTGFIADRFAQDKPLNMNAYITFEQSYSEIDGDSATAAEIISVLSALSGIPIRQDLAITGSVNQKGDIQPIGGVNEKIRGFYDICKQRKLTGSQGVVIPRQNINDLMLPLELIKDVKLKKFHIYSVNTIEEALEIMMDYPSGYIRPKNGINKFNYPENSIYGKANKRLIELTQAVQETKQEKKQYIRKIVKSKPQPPKE